MRLRLTRNGIARVSGGASVPMRLGTADAVEFAQTPWSSPAGSPRTPPRWRRRSWLTTAAPYGQGALSVGVQLRAGGP
jgi:hypothetical protein